MSKHLDCFLLSKVQKCVQKTLLRQTNVSDYLNDFHLVLNFAKMVKVGGAFETKIVWQGLVKMVRHVDHLLFAGCIELSALE